MDARQVESVRAEFEKAHKGEKGQCRLRLCAHILLFYDGPFQENTEGVLHFYNTVLPLIKESVTYYDVDGRWKHKKIKKDAFEVAPYLCATIDAERFLYSLVLESGMAVTDMSDKAFYLYHMGEAYPGFVRVILPLETLLDSAAPLRDLALEAGRRLRLLCGYGGIGVNMYDYPSNDKEDVVYYLSRRYQGIDFVSPFSFREYQTEGITSVNWLTFLGETYLDRLGGDQQLRRALDERITVHGLDRGVMIQAGPEPIFGDVNQNEDLSCYHAVGRALTPIRLPEEELGIYDAIGGTENTRRWLARFDATAAPPSQS